MSLLMVGNRAPNAASAMDEVLLVVNTASADSIDIGNYYVLNRPGATNVDVCPVNCVTTETIVYADAERDIKTPIANWCLANPSKPKKYVILCLGVPTRCTSGPSGKPFSVPYMVSTLRTNSELSSGNFQNDEYSSRGPFSAGMTIQGGDGGRYNEHYSLATHFNTRYLVMNLNMGNSAPIVKRYIDKVAAMHRAMTVPNVTVTSRGASQNGTLFMYNDSYLSTGPTHYLEGPENLLRTVDGCTTTAYFSTVQNNLVDLAAYYGWGTHNGTWGSGTYPWNNLVLSGKSNWYIVANFESFNGQVGGGMGNYIEWFNDGAGGGTNGSRTPIGMACHTEEPQVYGCETECLFRNWFLGFNLAETLWAARGVQFFMAVGDPLVAW